MKRIVQLGVLLVFACGAVILWTHLFPGPERQIRRRMIELQELVSFHASDGNLAALADVQRLGSLFTRDAGVRVEVDGGPRRTFTGRDEIMQAAVAARQVIGTLDVEFLDVVVTLSADEQSADVEAIGRAREHSSNELWIEDMRFKFILTEEGWQISSVETVQTLTRTRGGRMPWGWLPEAA